MTLCLRCHTIQVYNLLSEGTAITNGNPILSRQKIVYIFAVIAVVVVISFLYWPSMSQGFFCDDYLYLNLIRPPASGLASLAWIATGIPASEFHGYFRPLHDLIFAIIFRLSEGAYLQHAINVILHILNALLIVLFCRRFFSSQWAGVIAALTFGIWPYHAQVVTWVSGRADLLSTFFFLIGLLFFDNFLIRKRHSVMWMIFAVIAAAAALASKEAALAFPFVCATLAVYRAAERSQPVKNAIMKSLKQSIPLYAVALIFVLLRIFFANKKPMVLNRLGFAHLPANIVKAHLAWFFRVLPGYSFGVWAQIVFGLCFLSFFLWAIINSFQENSANKNTFFRSAIYLSIIHFIMLAPAFFFVGWPGVDLQRSRFFYLPSAAFAFILGAVMNLIFMRSRPIKTKLVIAALAVFWGIVFSAAWIHVQAYCKAAKVFNVTLNEFYNVYPRDSGRPAAIFLPSEKRGVPVFTYGFPEAVRLHCPWTGKPPDAKVYPLEKFINPKLIQKLLEKNYAILVFDGTDEKLHLFKQDADNGNVDQKTL